MSLWITVKESDGVDGNDTCSNDNQNKGLIDRWYTYRNTIRILSSNLLPFRLSLLEGVFFLVLELHDGWCKVCVWTQLLFKEEDVVDNRNDSPSQERKQRWRRFLLSSFKPSRRERRIPAPPCTSLPAELLPLLTARERELFEGVTSYVLLKILLSCCRRIVNSPGQPEGERELVTIKTTKHHHKLLRTSHSVTAYRERREGKKENKRWSNQKVLLLRWCHHYVRFQDMAWISNCHSLLPKSFNV